jgi:ABC-2 type transport system ATP-binding protein
MAVDSISFSIDQGQIVGFLGPNGAGKTTTIRMLTCFLPATQGRASVLGYDVFEQSIEVRRRIGYLPEATPVYPEMRVEEYLRYRARLKGVPRSKTEAAVDRSMDRTQIGEVRRQIIGQLSKGYRQRVGLADALVASPPILILDEPTIGLDPNQIRQTRSLIRGLGEDHTVFLSTHILPEVEQVCDRVVIIHRGKLRGEGTPSELRERISQGVRLKLEIKWQPRREAEKEHAQEIIEHELGQIEGVREVKLTSGEAEADQGLYRISVLASNDDIIRDRIFYAAVESDWVLRELSSEAMSLEEVFAAVTHEEDEDEDEDDEDGEDEDDALDEGEQPDEDDPDEDEQPDEDASDEDEDDPDDARSEA